MSGKTKTMYMQTLDGRPAIYQTFAARSWIAYASGRTRAKLLSSLAEIRHQQRLALDTAEQDYADVSQGERDAAVREMYDSFGYVLVEVPNER